MLSALPIALALLALALLPCQAPAQSLAKPDRHLAIVLDTSESMRKAGNDEPRLAIQAIKILADMLGPNDDLTLAWMPHSAECRTEPDNTRRIDMKGGDLADFKRQLEQRTGYDSGATNFIVPLSTAKQALEASTAKERLLIVISDAGSDRCRSASNRVLKDLRAAGVHTASVSVGSSRALSQTYDTPTAARDPSELLTAIGEIYQRFLGAKAPDSGRLSPGSTAISAEVAPFVGEAFLLVAAEGPVGAINPLPGNPAAEGVDASFRADRTRGLDNRTRGYRILRLGRPEPGTWRFDVGGLSGAAGWYLIQDFSVSMRFTPPARAAQGADTLLTLELIDDSTGQRIQRPGRIPDLTVHTMIEGTKFVFSDDGSGGDPSADDGLMTAKVRFMKPGPASFPLRLASKYLQDEQQHRTEVIEAHWMLEVRTPLETFVDNTIAVAVKLVPVGARSALKPPELIQARFDDGRTMPLRDNGRNGDAQAGDGVYGREWTPVNVGTMQIAYSPEGGGTTSEAEGQVEVKGTIAFGKPGALELGQLTSSSEGQGTLDLGFIKVRGHFPIQLSSDFSHRRSNLEIDLGQGFTKLDSSRLDLRVAEGGNRQWAVLLRVGDCPAGVEPDSAGVVVEARDHQGKDLRAEVPIRVEVVEDSWLHCWWPVIAGIFLTLLALFILHGIFSPARFPRNLSVILSPESDTDEGYPFNVRSQKGARSGFYRDARMYITTDYQLRPSGAGALARLRADRMGVFIQPLPGNRVLELNADDEWETMSTEHESRVRFSRLYKNLSETLFFEFRNL